MISAREKNEISRSVKGDVTKRDPPPPHMRDVYLDILAKNIKLSANLHLSTYEYTYETNVHGFPGYLLMGISELKTCICIYTGFSRFLILVLPTSNLRFI